MRDSPCIFTRCRPQPQFAERGSHVLHALAGECFDTGRVVEDFDADPALVLDAQQSLENRTKSTSPMPGPCGWDRWHESGASTWHYRR